MHAGVLVRPRGEGDSRFAVFPLASDAVAAAAAIQRDLAAETGPRRESCEWSGKPLDETFAEYLREKRLLLLLDNFEQVVPAAPVVGALLSAAQFLEIPRPFE